MSDTRQTLFALSELISITRTLAETLKDTARELHEDNALSVSERSVLLELRKHGPLTVPDLARRREVSRQFIQATVNPLLVEGVLEAQDNPAHKRSKLVALTEKGNELIRQIMKREGALMNGLAADLEADEIRQAAETMTRVEGLLERRRG